MFLPGQTKSRADYQEGYGHKRLADPFITIIPCADHRVVPTISRAIFGEDGWGYVTTQRYPTTRNMTYMIPNESHSRPYHIKT